MIHDRAGASRGQPAGGLRNNRATYSNSDSDVNGIHVVLDRYWSVSNDLFVDILGNRFTSGEDRVRGIDAGKISGGYRLTSVLLFSIIFYNSF